MEWLQQANIIDVFPVFQGMGIDVHEEMFCLIVRGESMSPKLRDGDWLVVDPRQEFVCGNRKRIGVVKLKNGDTTVKWVSRAGDAFLVLEAQNDEYKRRVVEEANVERIYKIVRRVQKDSEDW